MKRKGPRRADINIHTNAKGGYQVRLSVGTPPNHHTSAKTFPPGTPKIRVRAWRDREEARLQHLAPGAGNGTLAGDAVAYLRPDSNAKLTITNHQVRTRALAWWCAQPAALNAPVWTVQQVAEQAALRAAGTPAPQQHGATLGEQARASLDSARLQQVLNVAFKAPDHDPARYDSSHNQYRLALWHLFVVLDAGNPYALNPLATIPIRSGRAPQEKGQDMRIVQEIVAHAPSKFGRDSTVTQVRVAVLAYVHIRMVQLMQVVPARDFHDVPGASREDILAGAITLTVQPHLKGLHGRRVPAATTIPLNPWGVLAMRAFAATPAAHGHFSEPPLNQYVKRGAQRAQASLAARGVVLDLAKFTAGCFKHSLATAADLATGGVMDRQRGLRIDDGVIGALGHRAEKTSRIYTQAAVAPHVRRANAALTLYLEDLFSIPLVAPQLALVRHA